MTYSYVCSKCGGTFELIVSTIYRDSARTKPCQLCKKKGGITREFHPWTINYEGNISPSRRAGSGWNDVLKKISKGAGKRSMVIHD